MKIIRLTLTAALAAMTVSAVVLAPAAFAQDKMAPKMAPKMGGKMAPKMASVYVCKVCKMGFTETQAKKMGMKDPMGHKMMKMAKLPAGYKMAPMTGKTMDHKMDKMAPKMGDKMAPMPKM